MVIAEFGSGQVFISILWLFLFIIWFWLLITVFTDLFRDHETAGWAKAILAIVIIALPYLGVLIYLIVRGGGMAARAHAAQAQAESQFANYVRHMAAASEASKVDELARLADLRDRDAITSDEYDALKDKLLDTQKTKGDQG